MLYRQYPINEARLAAGLFVHECLDLFEISHRTWYRWCQSGAPGWAYLILELQAGHLDSLGWRHWQIRHGTLYCNDLSFRYCWQPGDLLKHAWNLTPVVIAANLSLSANDGRAFEPASVDSARNRNGA